MQKENAPHTVGKTAVASATEFSINVALMGRADRQFWRRPYEQPDSEKLIPILDRAKCVKNRVHLGESRNTYG